MESHSEDCLYAFVQAYRKAHKGVSIPWGRDELFDWIRRRGLDYADFALSKHRVADAVEDAYAEVL